MIDLKGFTLIVTGFPRSGTSMMMRALKFGGVEILSDPEYNYVELTGEPVSPADPYGVEELSNVGPMIKEHDKEWTANKAVKMVTPFIEWLPINRPLKVIFMVRDHAEIITSMLAKKDLWGMDIAQSVEFARGYIEHMKIPTLFVQYHEMVKYPKSTAVRIEDFLGVELNVEEMIKAADPNVRTKYKRDHGLTDLKDPILSLNAEVIGATRSVENPAAIWDMPSGPLAQVVKEMEEENVRRSTAKS
jgi:hypothetical protein